MPPPTLTGINAGRGWSFTMPALTSTYRAGKQHDGPH